MTSVEYQAEALEVINMDGRQAIAEREALLFSGAGEHAIRGMVALGDYLYSAAEWQSVGVRSGADRIDWDSAVCRTCAPNADWADGWTSVSAGTCSLCGAPANYAPETGRA